ncbi:sporulation protein [Bailinhaonella thermotolerans]|uniref:Sporulation protein n=1 Tax=Bailinhaonella thermotolerans TaxID=1070861 RepID=A0A3A4A6L5_9ACTN|nr:sporulation protein [Bailinhaonella thermotolerans]RJL21442.1 sporulation protein [Bailinhaonella thermotolerans]
MGDIMGMMERAKDVLTVRRVFGEPVEREGVTVIPVATVIGGGGGGDMIEPDDKEGSGSGFGFGTFSTGIGVFVIKDGKVSWEPAVNVNLIVLGGQLVGIVSMLALRSIIKSRRERGAGRS